MTQFQGQIAYRSLHAPQEDGAALIEPSIAEFTQQASSHFQSPPAAQRASFGSASLAEHKEEARCDLYQLLPDLPRRAAPLILVGHQPHLFHPGVWMKNAVAAQIARSLGGDAVYLVVDNDLMKSSAITVPSREGVGAVAQIEFDAPSPPMPYEERILVDRSLAESFASRVHQTAPESSNGRLIESFWPEVLAQLDHTPNWGQAIAAARQKIESNWSCGLHNLPLSRLVGTRSFARLALEIVTNAASFAETYNASLAEYRQVHKLRSRSHPAPDLEILSADEIELPFWLWTAASPQRRRTFVRYEGDCFTITDRESLSWSASLSEGDGLLDRMIAELLAPSAAPQRPKLRPKALLTTLYCRLLLCDGFVHGIGGAKYDQVTEALAYRWGLGTLAPMQCATMTMRLPLPMEKASPGEAARRKRRLRDLAYHPETLLNLVQLSPEAQSRAQQLAAQKAEWIKRTAPEELHERHLQIGAINAELSTLLGDLRHRFESDYEAAHHQQLNQLPWLSREFAAILFPEEALRDAFARVSAV